MKQVSIRELREDRGLTQNDMAKKIGVHVNIYSKYERGEVNMPAHTFGKICNIFKVSRDAVEIPGCEIKNYYKNTNEYFYEKGLREAYAEIARFAGNRA